MNHLYLLFTLGFIILLVSGRYIVSSGVSLARKLNISALVVGVVVISLGTSAPEFFVSLRAALDGHPNISIGNVIGSNISNIGLVLGLTALVFPLAVKSTSIKLNWPVMMLSGILLYLFLSNENLGRLEGFIFIFILFFFIVYTLYSSRKKNKRWPESRLPAQYSLFKSLIILVLASAGLLIGAKWVVEGAVFVAQNMGISDRVISVSIIAVGTSLPELTTSLMAALKKEPDISIGNIIGSNIYNIFGILGTSAIFKPLKEISSKFETSDIWWMLGFSLMLFLLILPLKSGKLFRYKGLLLLSGYIIYIWFLF